MFRLAPMLLFTFAAAAAALGTFVLRPADFGKPEPPRFSIDEQQLVAAARFGQPRVWDLAGEDHTGRPISVRRRAGGEALAWWLEGRDTLWAIVTVTGKASLELQQWNLDSGEQVGRRGLPGMHIGARIVPSADGSRFAIVPFIADRSAEAVIELHRAAIAEVEPVRVTLSRPLIDISLSRSGDRLLCLTRGGWVEVWETEPLNQVATFACEDFTEDSSEPAIALSPMGGTLLASTPGRLELRRVADQQVLLTMETSTSDLLEPVGFSGDGQVALLRGERKAFTWDVGRNALKPVPIEARGSRIGLSPSGRFVAVIGERTAQLWDRARGEERLVGAVPWAWLPDARLVAGLFAVLAVLSLGVALRRRRAKRAAEV